MPWGRWDQSNKLTQGNEQTSYWADSSGGILEWLDHDQGMFGAIKVPQFLEEREPLSCLVIHVVCIDLKGKFIVNDSFQMSGIAPCSYID